MKYKLLKDTPSHKEGTICTQGLSEQTNLKWIYPLGSADSICRTEDVTNEWFSPYLFTTEDLVDVYKGDIYYTIISNNSYMKVTAFGLAGYDNGVKRFSTVDAAQKYLDSLNVPEYVKLLNNQSGYKENDVAKVIEKKDGGYIVHMPNRISNSYYSPNVWYIDCMTEVSTKEEYEAQFVKYNTGDWIIASIGDVQYIGRYVDSSVKLSEWCSFQRILIKEVNSFEGGSFSKIDRLATHEEIETYLMLLAESKGFVKGVCFYGVDGAKMNEPIEIGKNWDIYFHPYISGLYCDDSWIYKDSKWATIVEKPEPKAEYFYYHTSGTFDVELTGKVTDVSINDNKVRINYTT